MHCYRQCFHRWSTMLYEFGEAQMRMEETFHHRTVRAIQFTLEMFQEGLINPTPWITFEDAGILFKGGLVAARVSGTWNLQNYHLNIKDFEWCATTCHMMSRDLYTRRKAACCSRLRLREGSRRIYSLVTDKEQSKRYCEESMFVSPRLDCAESTMNIVQMTLQYLQMS